MKKKVVILAAGWGTRLRPLTLGRPKPAIRILNDTLIEHNLREMKGLVDEAVIVVGYKDEVIKQRLKDNFLGIKIIYVNQDEQLGTGHAAQVALPYLDDEFLILNGDDLYLREDIEKCLQRNPSLLLKEVDDPSLYGQVSVQGEVVKAIIEKPPKIVSNLINVGCYYLNKSFFEKEIKKSSRGEYEIVDFLKHYISDGKDIYFVRAKNWMPVTYPWSILEAAQEVLEKKEDRRDGVIEEGVTIRGKLIAEKGSVIKTGTVIEGSVYIGKNTVVGPGAFLARNTAVHDNCLIGTGVEVKNSVIFSNTNIPHFAFIGDSVVGENCIIGAGVSLINFLFGGDFIWAKVKGKKISTGRKKMGAVIGNNVKMGANSTIMPGVMVADNSLIYPHTLLKENIE